MTVKINGTNTAAAPAFTGADTDTGLQCGTNEVKLVTGGTARVTVDSSGNLGLGTTSPNDQSSAGYTSLTLNNASSGSILDLRHNDTALSGGRMVGSANEFGLEARSQNAGSQISFYVNNAYAGRFTVNGLCFGNDTAAVNALDDYEEGTWTPIPYLSYNPSGRGITAATQLGRYTKIGQIVHVWFQFGYSLSGSGSFNLGINNLPFTAVNGNIDYNGGGVAREAAFTGYMFFCEGLTANTTNLSVLRRYDNGAPRDPSGTLCGHVTYEAA